MIITLFLNLIWGLLYFLIGVLPTGHIPLSIGIAFASIFGIANQFTYVFPVYTLMQALGIVIAIDGAILLWHFINWIIRKIPGMQ